MNVTLETDTTASFDTPWREGRLGNWKDGSTRWNITLLVSDAVSGTFTALLQSAVSPALADTFCKLTRPWPLSKLHTCPHILSWCLCFAAALHRDHYKHHLSSPWKQHAWRSQRHSIRRCWGKQTLLRSQLRQVAVFVQRRGDHLCVPAELFPDISFPDRL